jgi:nitric oxide dioxygenase
MLSEETVCIVLEITPCVADKAETATCFHERMFERHPEVRAFFNRTQQHSRSQQKASAAAIRASFSPIDHPHTPKSPTSESTTT